MRQIDLRVTPCLAGSLNRKQSPLDRNIFRRTVSANNGATLRVFQYRSCCGKSRNLCLIDGDVHWRKGAESGKGEERNPCGANPGYGGL